MGYKSSVWALVTLGVASLSLVGCFDNSPATPVMVDSEPTRQEAIFEFGGCSSDGYQQVENQANTADGEGHGPDLGSDEWRSVVEFKLGIRGDEALRALSREDWCRYIDEHYIQDHD